MSETMRAWVMRLTAIMLVVLGVIPTASLITDGNPLGWYPAAAKTWLLWTLAVVTIAVAVARVAPRVVERGVELYSSTLLKPRPSVFAAIVFAATVLLSLYFGWRLFALQPIVGDEFAQRFQAHILSMGHLSVFPEAPREFFSTTETLDLNGKWFAQFPMGGPMILAIGELMHAPWLVNPLLAAVAAVALYLFVSRIGDELTARSTTLLFVLCPFVIFMAGSEMNHVPMLALELIALAALVRWFDAESSSSANRMAAVIGGALGVAATIRPFDAAIVAAAIGVLQIGAVMKRRELAQSFIAQFVVGMIPVVLLLLANKATLGQPFAFAYDVLNGVEHRPGFHMTPLGFEHTPRRGLFNVSAYLLKLDVGLMAWPIPAMLVVAVALTLLRGENRWDRLMLGIVWLLLAGYTWYWSLSNYLGPRFLIPLAPIFVYYTARLPGVLRERLTNPTLRLSASLLIPIWLLIAWTLPPETGSVVGVRQLVSIYGSRSTAKPIRDAVEKAGLTNAVVFIQEGWHARLAGRLRAMTMRPLIAEAIVKEVDACELQHTLDAADSLAQSSPLTALGLVVNAMRKEQSGTPVPSLLPSDLVALIPQRDLTPKCQVEVRTLESNGASIAELLPYQKFDRAGHFTGDVIYARDFGERNERLRRAFGNRKWYVAQLQRTANDVQVQIVPYP